MSLQQVRHDQYMLGAYGESSAAAWYEELGYGVLQLRYRARDGEIDVIARAPDGTVVFAEVKTRRGTNFGAAEAVTEVKLRRIRAAAVQWLAEQSENFASVRFDVVEVLFDGVNVSCRMYQGVDDGSC
ncbi:YraN family protein [Corynebacterium sp. P3-F1]|uniref:YraN family protein n=1 Tax=Corynebacterium sp. P3-F1 TaxID=3059080 RepID=UPI00265C9D6C|nr:YraN family protein [Corynebacterium sp. P3-F1]WKK61776.1 YraN family protein [Corynebacterium sp. P3-F1]